MAALVILAAAPMAKLLFFLLLYRGAAAFMEPICDRRLTACADGMGKAHGLLLQTVLTVLLLFCYFYRISLRRDQCGIFWGIGLGRVLMG